jgi:hypothetical protein
LISLIIDLSAYPEETAITMKFNQAVRQYQSEYFVGYSEDGGDTWKEIAINDQLVVNDNPTNASYRVKLTGAKPSANFRVKIRINANYYYWIIDDVKLVERKIITVRSMKNGWLVLHIHLFLLDNPFSSIYDRRSQPRRKGSYRYAFNSNSE